MLVIPLGYHFGGGDPPGFDDCGGDPLGCDVGGGEPLGLDVGGGEPLGLDVGGGERLGFDFGGGDPLAGFIPYTEAVQDSNYIDPWCGMSKFKETVNCNISITLKIAKYYFIILG